MIDDAAIALRIGIEQIALIDKDAARRGEAALVQLQPPIREVPVSDIQGRIAQHVDPVEQRGHEVGPPLVDAEALTRVHDAVVVELALFLEADRLRAPMERHAYYAWLYAGDLSYDAADGGVFRGVHDGRFVGRDAAVGREYAQVALREAAYEPERVQFYRLVDIPFARELRKVSVDHPFPGLAVAAGDARGASR